MDNTGAMALDASERFIIRLFSKHYRESELVMPERFAKREFAFMFFERKFMMRHIGFPSRAALKNYLVEQVPAHVYYSCAYYEKPSAPKMPDKNWLGADLIFDLDADHVEGTKGLPYEEMLERVKREVKRLIDEFLLGDLGFQMDEMRIVFSGGRGYHVHINAPRVIKLSSHERREIVDYVTGTDLDMDWVFPITPFEAGRFKDRVTPGYKRAMPRLEDGGWKRRIRMGIDQLLDGVEEMDQDKALKSLAEMASETNKEIGKKTIEGLYKDLFGGDRGRRGADRMRSENVFEVFSEKRHGDAFLAIVEMRVKGKMRGETDEPVTSDIKRLIRLPSSLHGKTGFEVVPLTRERLDGFDPFVEAISGAFGNEDVSVSCKKPLDLRMKDRSYSLDIGHNKVPEHVAVYLLCRELADIEG